MDHTALVEREYMVGDNGVIAGLERAARRFALWAWINVGIAVAGGFLTLASYNTASLSGSYVALKGAIVLGPVFAVINVVRYLRTRSKINSIKTAARGTRPAAQNVPTRAAAGPAPQASGQVFNPPPGWPRMPEGWRPTLDWKPDLSWPAPPKGWSLLVGSELLMSPLDLSDDLDFGPPAQVTKKRLNEAADHAADAIAWQICRVAGESTENPLMTLSKLDDHVQTATEKAQDRIFTKLLAETNAWVQESQANIHEWEAALQHARMILERRDAFAARSRQRIKAVISAAVAPPRQDPPPAPRPAPEFIRTVPLSQETRAKVKPDQTLKRRDRILGWVALGILAVSGIVVFGVQAGFTPSSSAASPSMEDGFDPAVVKNLERQGDWAQSGSFYMKWVPDDQYSCTSGAACTEIWLWTPLYGGCKSAEAMVDLLQDGKAIGTARSTVNNLTRDSPKRVHIQAASGLKPDQVQINHVSCSN
nr:hypothetical protein [Pseudarthrobacter sp. B4EP4b]